MRELLLIRHGQASFGAEDYDRLSPVGEQQSTLLGEWLAATGPVPELVAIGPRRRHRDTASHCLQAAGVDSQPVLFQGLDEFDHHEVLARQRPDLAGPGALRAELKQAADPHRAFQRLFAEAVSRWVSGQHDAEYCRPWPSFREHVLESLQQLSEHPAATIWAFTSGGPIAVIANTLLGAPLAQTFKLSWPLVNTGITRLRLNSRGATLLTYNTWPHLERQRDSALVTLR
jgi:broad specificity phosphatase PhoE